MTGAVLRSLTLLWVVDLREGGDRGAPRWLRLLSVPVTLFWASFVTGPPVGLGEQEAEAALQGVRPACPSPGSSIPRLVHPPGSSIPPALRVSRKSVATSDAVGHPWGLAAVGVLASFGLASLWAQPCAWLAE